MSHFLAGGEIDHDVGGEIFIKQLDAIALLADGLELFVYSKLLEEWLDI